MNGSNNLVPNKVIKNHATIFTSYGSNYHIHNLVIERPSGTNMLNIMSKGSGLIVVENSKFIKWRELCRFTFCLINKVDVAIHLFTLNAIIHDCSKQHHTATRHQHFFAKLYWWDQVHGSNSSATDNTIVGCWPAIYVTSG